jgi:hypothetical protein
MALDATQKAQVRYYLGWSARFHQFDSRLEQAMDALAVEPEAEVLVEAALAALADIDTKLTDSHKRIKAQAVGSIILNDKDEVSILRSEGRRHVGRISSTLGVATRHDVFGGGTYTGFASFDGISGGGNVLKY